MEAIMKGCLDQANIAIVKWIVGVGAAVRLDSIGDMVDVGAWRIEIDEGGTHVDVYSPSEGSGMFVNSKFAESPSKAIGMIMAAYGLYEDGAYLLPGFDSRAAASAARFLDRRGYEILDVCAESPDGHRYVVAMDEGAVVLARVVARSGYAFESPVYDEEAMRASFELMAAAYLADKDELVDKQIRFDVVSILIVANDRAIIRHAINVMAQ